MTTVITRPIYEFVNGVATLVGTTDEVLEGDAEEQYLADVATRNAYQTLRQWADDAAQVNTDWPTMTQAQKDNALRETIRRLGVFLDRFADLLLLEGRRS